MAYRSQFTPLALSDMDDALTYIAGRLSNPAAAARLYRAVETEIDSICGNPFAYPNCSNYLIDDSNMRHAVIGNYILVYRVCEEQQRIQILRFLYGGMDIAGMELR
ncbi:MAG: type II toxin-antitoxin system RelE/ParE family toxin [Oscillospiraceae bacterium]|nr:type II toxin-antitoxin system RelE/ParE family toxin [Oscillospiraceae bacterium]